MRLEHVVEQRCRADVAADLARRDEEAQRSAVRVGDGMETGIHAAFGATNQASEPLVFFLCLDAVRCAFTQLASIMTIPGSASADVRPSIIRRKNPHSPHRFQR